MVSVQQIYVTNQTPLSQTFRESEIRMIHQFPKPHYVHQEKYRHGGFVSVKLLDIGGSGNQCNI